jgi:DNA-binding NarL/FixJ family response regulator
MSPIQVYLIDDHPMVIEGIKSILSAAGDVLITGHATNAFDAVAFLRRYPTDVILLDINLPDVNGIELCRKIKQEFPQANILGLSTFNDRTFITHMLRNGAAGYLLKNATREELLTAIYAVRAGGQYLSSEVSELLVQPPEKESPPIPLLTRREKEVLDLIAEGLTNQRIADKIFVSPLTVDSHRKNLLAKFGVKNTAALISFAAKHNLI